MLKFKGITREFTIHREYIESKIHIDFTEGEISFDIGSEKASRFLQVVEKFFGQGKVKKEYLNTVSQLKDKLTMKLFDRKNPKKAIIDISKLLHKIVYEDKVSL